MDASEQPIVRMHVRGLGDYCNGGGRIYSDDTVEGITQDWADYLAEHGWEVEWEHQISNLFEIIPGDEDDDVRDLADDYGRLFNEWVDEYEWPPEDAEDAETEDDEDD